MERTQIYLTSVQKARLEAVARARSVSMADVVREAVDKYLLDIGPDQLILTIRETFGVAKEWKDRDGVEIQRELRSMWGDGAGAKPKS